MVGAKSLGCLECKRRKVKCDQRFPKCANCERVGRWCSGPKSHFIRFVRPGAEEHMNTVTVSQYQSLKSPRSTVSERLSADLVRQLRDIDNVGYQLQCFGVFVSFLPARIGHNRALDAAVKCLLQVHSAMIRGKTLTTHTEGLDSYNESIALIRKDLNDKQTQTNAETVCAALILSTYELYKRDHCHSWVTHAGGVAAILQCWGPDRFVSDFEMALFASHYGSTVSTSIIYGKSCFLDAPEWHALRGRCLKTFPGLDKYTMDCLTALARLPNLLQSIRKSKASARRPIWSREQLQLAQEFKAMVSQHALKLHLDFLNPELIWERASTSSYSNQTMLVFAKPRIAFRYNFYWAVTIIANKILLAFGEDDQSLVEEYRDAAEDICRSFEYLQTLRPLGILWLNFAASMAYGVSGEATRQRIVEEMEEALFPIQIEATETVLNMSYNMLTGGIDEIEQIREFDTFYNG